MVADRPTRVPVNEVQKRVEGHDPRCTRAPSPVASQNPPKAPGVPQHGRGKGSGRDEKKIYVKQCFRYSGLFAECARHAFVAPRTRVRYDHYLLLLTGGFVTRRSC